jgi:UDP-N-acetylglucosamine 2-epimerase (non-hydrolysing)
MKKAALVVGTRPQFVKTAPLIIELGRFFQMVLIHTGQHYDFRMSEGFFGELEIPDPDYHLEAAESGPGRGIGKMIDRLESILSFERPDKVIVVGDTNSTLAGALAAVRLRLPLAHVEAGVRAKDTKLPEQINRVMTDAVADYLFCPTLSAVNNLKREGKNDHLYDTGDVIYDCLRLFYDKIPDIPLGVPSLPEKFILATIHRAEAVDNRENLESVLVSFESTELPIIFPIHPRTRKRIACFGLEDKILGNITLTDPLGYLDILSLIRRSEYVITDSGGIQREAAYLGKFVILARPETEWLELEENGWLKIAGYSFDLAGGIGAFNHNPDSLKHLTRPASSEIARILNSL